MSQDFKEVLNAQIADLKEEMGIIDPPESSVEPVQEVVEEVKQDQPTNKLNLREQTKSRKISSFPIPKGAKKKAQMSEGLSDLFTSVEKRAIVGKVNVIKDEIKKPEVIKEEIKDNTVERTSQILSAYLDKEGLKVSEEFIGSSNHIDQRFTSMQMQINSVSSAIRGLSEHTMVSGIGQGGDGQTPGSGEVRLERLDDVDVDGILVGETLVWAGPDKGFVPGTGGVAEDDVVKSILAGVGIDVQGSVPPGKGDVTIALDASINNLNDVDTSTASEGQALIYQAGSWGPAGVTTNQVDLTNPSGNPFNIEYPRYNSITPSNVYSTQEDANQLFGALINDLDDRVESIENATKPGTFLGLIDVTDAANEPDNSGLNQGDYYIHDGASGPLWGTGDNVDDGDSVIWNGATWEIIATTTTLSQLGDVNISGAISGQMLVYNDSTARWYNETVTIPKVFIDTVTPAGQGEKDGDFWFKSDTEILHIYDSVWTEVSGSGAGSSIGHNPPANPDDGSLWVDTDDYNLYSWDGEQWIDLTGGAGGDAAYVTLGDLNATVDTVNFNINQVQNNLGAAVVGLDATHLRITPQAPLAGPLTLSSDLTFDGSANQIISVDNAKSLKIKGSDANGSSRTFIDVQNADSSGSDGADDGYRVKMYHVADPTEDHHVANKKYVDQQTGSGVPVGSIMMWINAVAPSGWLKLKGGSFNISTYPLLHAYLQQSEGYVSGQLPDWQGHYPGQLGDHLSGSVGGMHTQRTAKPSGGSPKSSHKFNDGHTDSANKAGGTNYADTPTREVVIDTGWDSVTRPPTIAVHFIIKHD